jgi:hypothetical protein
MMRLFFGGGFRHRPGKAPRRPKNGPGVSSQACQAHVPTRIRAGDRAAAARYVVAAVVITATTNASTPSTTATSRVARRIEAVHVVVPHQQYSAAAATDRTKRAVQQR